MVTERSMHLYAAYLGGGLTPGRMGEDHEVVFVVAEDAQDAKRRAKEKWHGDGRGHVDAVQRIDVVDGYAVALGPGDGGDRLTLDSYN
jgi:Domain of Unknown Function (DUF1543)